MARKLSRTPRPSEIVIDELADEQTSWDLEEHGDCGPRRWGKHWQRDSTRNHDPEKEVSPRGCPFLDLLSFKHRRLLKHAHHPGRGAHFICSTRNQIRRSCQCLGRLGEGFGSATFWGIAGQRHSGTDELHDAAGDRVPEKTPPHQTVPPVTRTKTRPGAARDRIGGRRDRR